MFLANVIFCLSVAQYSVGARILGVVPTPSYSHQHFLHPIWRELSLRGHSVTVITTDPVNAHELTNLSQIDVGSAYKFMQNFYHELPNLNLINNIPYMHELFDITNDFVLSLPEVQHLIQSNQNFDLVLIESYHPEFLAFGEIFKCPIILISSMDLLNIIHVAVGNPYHPALYPEYTLPFYGKLSLTERIISTIYQTYTNLYLTYIEYPRKHKIAMKHFRRNIPSIMDMLNNVDLILLGTDHILGDVRPLGPMTIRFGGIHLLPPKPLPKDLKKYLDSAENGFIYFSLGTNVQSHLLTKEKMNIILDTLKELPYKILWKFASDIIPDIPNNVKIMKWIPQQDVLRHPNIKLFITQGGLQSIEEAIMYNVPMLVIPFFVDQHYNAKRLENKKVARIVSYQYGIQKNTLQNLILEVINNPIYKENTKKLAKLAMDQPMTGLEKVVWWTEYVIRNGGAKHLRNPAADIPLYQYFLLDVAAAFIVLLSLIAISFVVVGRILKTILGITRKILTKLSRLAFPVEKIIKYKQEVSKQPQKSKTS